MPDHNYFSNLIWQIADLLHGPYGPPQYERVMLPITVLRRFDCVFADTKKKVLVEHERYKRAIAENVRVIFDFFESEAEIERMREATQLAIAD